MNKSFFSISFSFSHFFNMFCSSQIPVRSSPFLISNYNLLLLLLLLLLLFQTQSDCSILLQYNEDTIIFCCLFRMSVNIVCVVFFSYHHSSPTGRLNAGLETIQFNNLDTIFRIAEAHFLSVHRMLFDHLHSKQNTHICV